MIWVFWLSRDEYPNEITAAIYEVENSSDGSVM